MVLFNVHMHCNYIVTKDSLISTIAKAIFTQCWIAFAIWHELYLPCISCEHLVDPTLHSIP